MSILSKDRDANTQAWLEELFNAYENNLNGLSSHPISKFKKDAFLQLQAERFPTRRDEDWKYTNVGPIIKPPYKHGEIAQIDPSLVDEYSFEDLDVVKMVFINGILDRSLSALDDIPSGAQLTSMADALKDDNKAKVIKSLKAQKSGTAINTFLPMNHAFAKHGYFLEADKNTNIQKPFHFIYINTRSDESHFTHPQMFINTKASSSITVVESFHSTDPEAVYFNNSANFIHVGMNAKVDHYKLQYESKSAYQINNTIVTQARDSEYSHYSVDLGGKIVRNNLSSQLLESGTQTNYYGIYLGLDKQHIDNQTFIDHAMPHCQSNEMYKGILSDKARGIFNGKVLVRQDAQKTNAFQQSSSLVLSNDAVMDAKPQLEIYADDVKCSHGATIGQLDDNSVFYLKSRGLNDQAARNLLQKAFLGEVVNHFRIDAIREKVLVKIEDKLSRI